MKRQYRTVLVLAAAVVLIGVGLWQGQQSAVLEKAIRVCLECVGIG